MFFGRPPALTPPPTLTPLEKDAMRYRFIRKAIAQTIEKHPEIAGIQVRPPGKKHWFDTVQDFDEAIDEAIKNDRKRT